MLFRYPVRSGVDLALWDLSLAPALAAAVQQNLAHLGRWLPWATADYDVDQAAAFIRNALRGYAEDGRIDVAILSGDQILGALGMVRLNASARSTELGYWLAESAQGRGIMTDAVRVFVHDLFTARGFERVVIAAQPENVRSRAIPERLGFRLEGILRHVARHGASYVDLAVYACLAEEWPAASALTDAPARTEDAAQRPS